MTEHSSSEHSSSEHSASEHSSSLTLYVGIWLALLFGTVLTVVAAHINLGPFNAAVALTIATIKATLVALYFMHVKGSSEKMTKVVVISAIFFLLLLLALSMADYGTRTWS
jgi:cytochrome c oxidase subunit IV